jgi:hypothetical protein
VNDHVGDLGPLLPNPRLDLARPLVRLVERLTGADLDGDEGDEPLICAPKTYVARWGAGELADDLGHDRVVLQGVGARSTSSATS